MFELNYLQGFRILGIVFSTFLIIAMFFLVKARRIQEKYSLVWFSIGIFTLVFSLSTELMEWLSRLIGVDYAPSAFFSILIVCAYLLLLNMSISISTLKKQNKNLIQEIGLLNLKIEESKKDIERKS